MDEVDDLVLTPFKEIVEKAQLARDNAGDGNPLMLQAAQTLLKEGERGLKKISPLCKKQLEDYGSSFIASLKDNDEIANFRTQLTDLLWEFDDFIEPDDFDAAKFDELRSLSRKAAPKIYDILMRMKLDTPMSDATSSRGSFAQLPTPTSPPFHSSNPALVPPGFQGPNGSLSDIHDATSQLRNMMRSPSDNGSIRDSREPPKPPMGNPWDWQSRPDRRLSDEVERRHRLAEQESPVLPVSSPNDDHGMPFAVVHPPPANVVGSYSSQTTMEEEERRQSGSERSFGNYPAHNYSNSRQRHTKFSSFSIPENEVSDQPGTIPFFHPSAQQVPNQHQRHPSYATSIGSDTSETKRPDLVSLPSNDSRNPSRGSHSTPGFGGIDAAATSYLQSPPPQEPPPPPPIPMSAETIAQMDCAPIPVESEMPSQQFQGSPAQIESCRITDDSSFNLAKGFCEGAKEVIRGGIGVKRIKKPGFATAATVARCVDCLYEMDFADIETDVNRQDKGTYSRNGVAFRARFLQKSHIATKRVDDVQYGCVFCVQLGHTIDRSDATVFFTQKALFDHLARHTRPLPEIAGMTVIEGDSVPDKHHNDFDIHFRRPPMPHPVIERSNELATLPSGITKDQARRMYGQRLLHDRSAALELAQGARITGITWPSQYGGEWCFGWHDGHYASIPTDLVRLEQPPGTELKFDKRSAIRATSRWKFAVKDKDKVKGKDQEDWLKFDKHETISNIAYIDENHWCWSGTNAKGKWGIFPQAYLDPASVKEPASTSSAGRAGSVNEEKARSSAGLMGKFSMRKNSGRSPSISGSGASIN